MVTTTTTTTTTKATSTTTTTTTTTSATTRTETNEDHRYLVLVEFAYRHVDFHMAELESILDIFGIRLDGPDCKCHPLPNQTQSVAAPSSSSSSSSSSSVGKEYNQDQHNNNKNKHQNNNKDNPTQSTGTRPFVILSFPAKDAERLGGIRKQQVEKWDSTNVSKTTGIAEMLSRCTLVKSVMELWGCGTTMEECAKATQRWVNDVPLGKSIFPKVASQSWKITIHTLGSKYTREEQDAMRKQFSYIGLEGPVQLNDPDHEYVLIREVELNKSGSPLYPRHHLGKTIIPENDARPPLACYFGRILGGIRKGREGLEQYSLKHRAYLGPTSMDAELSFIMTSLGQVRKGSIVFDPFVGTGSILLSCGIRGAYCVGADIDIRVLKGKTETETIWTNFEQFHLPRPEILRTDNSIYHKHFRDHPSLYDAIICDPPYGIRAGARKTGSKRDEPRPIADEHRHDHIPQTRPYPVSDVMADLLDVAARALVMGGRLVYVIPSFQNFDPDTDLPRHDCLTLVHSCYQPLGLELGRRIVAMKKITEYNPDCRQDYLARTWVNGIESAEKCANIRDKILENAKLKPGYEEKLAIRKEKRKATKEAKKRAKSKASTSPPLPDT